MGVASLLMLLIHVLGIVLDKRIKKMNQTNHNSLWDKKPQHNQVCVTKSIIGGYDRVCVWDEKRQSFHPIINGEIDKHLDLVDSARFWKKIL